MKFLKYESSDDIGILWLNRPEALNALSRSLLKEMSEFLEKKIKEGKTRVLIITGCGDRAFGAGADLQEIQEYKESEMIDFCSLGQKAVYQLKSAPFVTIAAIQGYALGGALEIALGCDLIYAHRKATLGLPEVSLGLIPGFGGISNLVEAIGMQRAKEMILTGKRLTAEEAYRFGLVHKLCEMEVVDESLQAAKGILKNSSYAVKKAKQAILEGRELNTENKLKIEREICAECSQTEETHHRIQKFLEK